MATTTATVYNQLTSEATQQAALAELTPNPDSAAQLLADVNSGSKVDIHRLWMWVVAYVHKVQQDLFDRFKVEVATYARENHYGTRRWFIAKAKAFQFGHTLVLTERDGVYAVDAPAARIVTHAAVVEMANTVLVKVAKAAGSGLSKLTPAELVAVNDYFQELRPPVQVSVLTADADRIRITGSVVYDGQQPLSGVQAALNLSIGTYLRGLDFGGIVRVTDLRAAMLATDGVVDVRLERVEVRTTGPWLTIPRIHYTYAGHAIVDPTAPITDTMEFGVGNV